MYWLWFSADVLCFLIPTNIARQPSFNIFTHVEPWSTVTVCGVVPAAAVVLLPGTVWLALRFTTRSLCRNFNMLKLHFQHKAAMYPRIPWCAYTNISLTGTCSVSAQEYCDELNRVLTLSSNALHRIRTRDICAFRHRWRNNALFWCIRETCAGYIEDVHNEHTTDIWRCTLLTQ